MAHKTHALIALNTDAGDLFKDIQYFATPLNAGHDSLADVQNLLKKPAEYRKKLGKVSTALSDLETVCKSGEWIPEAGVVAKGGRQFLGGINNFITPTRKVLKQIADDLKPLQDWISEVQKPLNEVWSSVGAVEGRVGQLEHVTAELRKHYKDNPPKGVESCAAVLQQNLHPAVMKLNDAKDEANAQLHTMDALLDKAWKALSSLLDVSSVIDMAYNALSLLGHAAHEIGAAVKKVANYGKKAIEFALSKVGRGIKGLYDKAKSMIGAVEKAIKRMRDKLVSFLFQPVQDAINTVAARIRDKLAKLPVVKKLEAAMDEMRAQLGAVVHAIEDQADPCKNIFAGQTAP